MPESKSIFRPLATAIFASLMLINTGHSQSNSAPVLNFNTPSASATFEVGTPVFVHVNASDPDGSVSNVRLSVDGDFLRQENVDPYEWGNRSDDTILENLSVGVHTLTAVATDNDGAATTESILIEIVAGSVEDTDSPVVTVNATDPDGSIENVRLSVDGEFVRQENRFPYEWEDTVLQNLDAGTHELLAVATDNAGNSSAKTITITVIGSSTDEPVNPVGGNLPNDNNITSNVTSLFQLREAIQRSNENIVMRPGNYNITNLDEGIRDLPFSGSNNTINLTGVYIEVPVGSTSSRDPYISMSGSNNTLIGGEFEDTYFNGATRITDFVAYNNDRENLAYGLRGEPVMKITGNSNTIDGIKVTVRGSFPFGYGSIFGIGANNSFGLSKRCGILVTGGNNNTLENVEVQQLAFCHGIFIQGGSDNTTIRNTLVEGLLRPTNEMLAEGRGSLPEQENYLTVDGDPIPANEVNSLAEDGIRAYGGIGSVTVENSTVRRMRGGIRLYLASSAVVRNSHAFDCGQTNWNMPRGGTVTNSSANFTYSTLSDFRLSRNDQNLEMTILPSPNAVGSHNIADILGNNHEIVFHRADGPIDDDEERVIVVSGNNSTIRNETEYRIVLNPGTSGNRIISAGDVTDNGSNNVSRINLEL